MYGEGTKTRYILGKANGLTLGQVPGGAVALDPENPTFPTLSFYSHQSQGCSVLGLSALEISCVPFVQH